MMEDPLAALVVDKGVFAPFFPVVIQWEWKKGEVSFLVPI